MNPAEATCAGCGVSVLDEPSVFARNLLGNTELCNDCAVRRMRTGQSLDHKGKPVDPSQGLGPGGKKNDAGKPRWDLLPRRVLGGIVAVLTYGAKTYADDSWQQVPNGLRRYLAAQERHLNDRLRGEELDKESGLKHAYHYGTNALFVTYKLAFCPDEVEAYAKATGYDSDASVGV